MFEIFASLGTALGLVTGADPELARIVALSLELSLAAAVLGSALGLPLGALVAIGRFPGRRALIVSLNALLGLPSVVVGLVVYLLLSRAGPSGHFGILFTPRRSSSRRPPSSCPSSRRSRARSSRTPGRVRGTADVARRPHRPRRAHAAVGHALLAAHGGFSPASAARSPRSAP
jgi:ABC-type dipeptide/oligopeptide/nickel transport system permease component